MNFLADIHPKIIHFPIAFLILYPLIEFLFLVTKKDFFSKAAFLFLITGVISSFFAVLSGNQAYESVKDLLMDKSIFYQHQFYANITVWSFTFLLALRYFLYIKKRLINKFIIILLILALSGSIIVFQTGVYGGKFSRQISKLILTNSNNN